LVKDSMAVMYDWIRGEPRGKLKQNDVQEDKGDCIDCKLCVHVCPTGIDIRNGTQLECVNCTACIDACDDVMLKIDKPKGLIRTTSFNAIEEGRKRIFTPRVAGYSGVLAILITLLIVFVSGRADVETTMLRVPGILYQKTDDGQIQNLYNIQFVNKTTEKQVLTLKIENIAEAKIERVGGALIELEANSKVDATFFVKLPPGKVTGTKTKLRIGVYSGENIIDEVKTNFLGPIKLSK